MSPGATPPVGAAGQESALTTAPFADAASGAAQSGSVARHKAARSAQAARHRTEARPHSLAARPASSERARRKGRDHHRARSRHHASARHAAALARQAQPYLIYDSITPEAIPGDPVIATYVDGPHPDSPSEVAGRSTVLWIDINGSDADASALDIEPGCATPSAAPGWVWRRLTAHPHAVAILYTGFSEWSEVQADVATLPSWMRARIRWWIADPTGHPHIVPGSQATQWYWGPNYDISTATPGF